MAKVKTDEQKLSDNVRALWGKYFPAKLSWNGVSIKSLASNGVTAHAEALMEVFDSKIDTNIHTQGFRGKSRYEKTMRRAWAKFYNGYIWEALRMMETAYLNSQ